MIYLTSDQHMYHTNIRRLADRPFDSDEEMREVIINNFNSKVTKEDDVYMLGDFLWKDFRINEVMPRLNFKTATLICGNHDGAHTMHLKHEKIKDLMITSGFTEVCDEKMIKIGKYLVKLCHFPYYDPSITAEYELRYLAQRPKKGPEDFMCHGHSHSKKDKRIRLKPWLQLDVGVDAFDYFPVSEKEILEALYG